MLFLCVLLVFVCCCFVVCLFEEGQGVLGEVAVFVAPPPRLSSVRLQSVLVAIVVPNEVTVKAWASTNDVAGATLHDWVGVEALQGQGS